MLSCIAGNSQAVGHSVLTHADLVQIRESGCRFLTRAPGQNGIEERSCRSRHLVERSLAEFVLLGHPREGPQMQPGVNALMRGTCSAGEGLPGCTRRDVLFAHCRCLSCSARRSALALSLSTAATRRESW